MPVGKKFGTFAGVYTPSVLTILGVIMYLRLGWVVGEAGLIAAIAIILVAHIISVSTGLSISSIATDKKIKTGGIYYILSRSLGLPMGGAIGITLFVGTALSIALYIVGFTENFLGIEAVSELIGMENNISSIRIIGSIVLLLLVIIAFISTSLALKSQFFVLGAIALSLISIALGFVFMEPSAMPEASIAPAKDHMPIITIFAIFFPAVTGFTAGVAMSGDLKDPQNSIPKGTMFSIATGLVIYILLAVGVAYFVDRDTLLNNSNFLLEVAMFSPLVIAGIWGATLSSALGGILGAPRIVQAIANDKILPGVLGKGFGASNEPRNALIFTFLLAEVGILIGELDAIAEVVSMFYIAAYGFINLAFALEKWASTDFRPSFSISKWVGIIGFLASFGVMLRLNPGAMLAAFVIMWVIYFLLKRRELKSDFGDVWGSVWSSVVRTSITKLSEKSLEKRNWKPNILLFSGQTKDRPHLLELGKQLIGKYGFLSHFDLKVSDERAFAYTKSQQLISNGDQSKGIFSRQHSVTDLYEGIEQISSTYGFAGVEPNTIFMGWARNTKEPTRFAQMLKNLYRLDQNVIMMDYDKRYGYGDRKQIDVWWRGQGQNGNLSLQLVKFLRESEDWSKSTLRLLLVNPVNDDHEKLYRQANEILSNLRIDGEVRVINNQIEKRSFYDIIHLESVNSNLIFMGLPDISDGQEKDFVERTNDLCHKIGSVVLVRASSNFLDLHIGSKKQKSLHTSIFPDIKWSADAASEMGEAELGFPQYSALRNANQTIYSKIQDIQNSNNETYLRRIAENENVVLEEVKAIIINSVDGLKSVIENNKSELLTSKISNIHAKSLRELKNKISNLQGGYIDEQRTILAGFVNSELKAINELYNRLPKSVVVNYLLADMKRIAKDSFDVRCYKAWSRFRSRFGKKSFRYSIQYRHLLIEHFLEEHLKSFDAFLQQYGLNSSENIVSIEMFVSELDKEVQKIYQLVLDSGSEEEFETVFKSMYLLANKLTDGVQHRMIKLLKFRESEIALIIKKLNALTSQVGVNNALNEEFNTRQALKKILPRANYIPDMRHRNQRMLISHLLLNMNLLIFSTQLRQFNYLIMKRMSSYLRQDVIGNYQTYLKYLKSYISRYKKNKKASFNFDSSKLPVSFDKTVAERLVNTSIKTHKSFVKDLPKTIEILNEESENLIGTAQQFGELTSVNLSVKRLVDYLVYDEFTSSFQEIINELPDKILSINHQLQDHLRLLIYNIENKDAEKLNFEEYLKSEIEGLENDLLENEDFVKGILMQVEENQRIIDEKFSIYPFVQAAVNLKQYIRKREIGKKSSRFNQLKIDARQWFRNQAANLWYRQSEGVILTQDLLSKENDSISVQKKQRMSIASISTSLEVVEKLPFYYKQLFTNRHSFMSEFWVERKQAEQELQNYVYDAERGLAGGLLISGLPGSGKSSLGYRLAGLMPMGTKVYTLSPPTKGSESVAVFDRMLREALEAENAHDIFTGIKKGSVIILEDVELWWTKSAKGFAVIDRIHQLIKKYSDSYHFVVIMNSFAFDFIAQLRFVSDIYTHYVSLGPMDARSLENMIWKRHLAGGVKLRLGDKNQDSFHSWDFAQLFSKYFRFSKGYPLTAMESWVNNILEYQDKVLEIRSPNVFDISVIETLSKMDFWILQLLIMHKQMNCNKLAEVSGLEIELLMRKLFSLHRIGIVEELNDCVYRLNPLLIPHMVQVLENKKYL